MVPDKFNIVDMGGIDLIMMQGEAVPGLYDKLMTAISNCRYQCLYNWLFDGVLIPPTYVQIEYDDDEVFLNEGVSVTSDDVIHIYSVEPGPVDPEIIPLLAEENGVYNVPAGKDGFNPVTVDVPSYTPVINSISITENGTYTAPTGVDGYSPITVNVSGGSINVLSGNDLPSSGLGNNGDIYLHYVGNDPSYPLPSDATHVSYIKNVLGQYIRTGYNGLDNSEFRIIFRYDAPQTQQYPIPFGGRRNAGSLGDCVYAFYSNLSTTISWGGNEYSSALPIGYSSILGKIAIVEFSKGTYTITFDGVPHTYTFNPTAIGTGTIDIGIFTGIFGNVYNNAFSSVGMCLFDFEIRESGTLVHKYIPCLDPNGVPCLYDYIAEEYLYNAGSGEFTYGAGEPIIMAYCKVNGSWQPLIGTDINDVN